MADEDLPLIEEWWPEAEATVTGGRDPDAKELRRVVRQLLNDPQSLAISLLDDPAPIGLLVYQPYDDGWLEFRWLGLAKGHRGWGYGSEAVRLVEEAGRAQRFAADVYAENGLGLYFWLRMGYRPGRPPWKRGGTTDRVTMIREQEE